MPSGFRLLVYAIAAVALLWVFYAYFAPFFFPGENAIEEIEGSLASAEGGLGKAFGKELVIGQGIAFQGKGFDSATRNVVFSCNRASLCCPKGAVDENCTAAIEWDERKAVFKRDVGLEVTARCELLAGIVACKLYLGEKPGQVELVGIEAAQEYDLAEGKPWLAVGVENTGGQDIFQGAVDARVFQLVERQGQWEEILIANAARTVQLGALKAGNQNRIEIELNLEEGGSYKTAIEASALEGGFDSNTVYFGVVGGTAGCTATGCDAPSLDSGECRARCYCTGCMLGSDCVEKLRESGGQGLGLGEADLETSAAKVLGSNIVEFLLPQTSC